MFDHVYNIELDVHNVEQNVIIYIIIDYNRALYTETYFSSEISGPSKVMGYKFVALFLQTPYLCVCAFF